HPHAHRADVVIRRRAEIRRASAEQLGAREHMGVYFESDYSFVRFSVHRFNVGHESCGALGVKAPHRSHASPARRIASSPKGGPINCNPIGMPSGSAPHGTDIPGKPARFTEIVK